MKPAIADREADLTMRQSTGLTFAAQLTCSIARSLVCWRALCLPAQEPLIDYFPPPPPPPSLQQASPLYPGEACERLRARALKVAPTNLLMWRQPLRKTSRLSKIVGKQVGLENIKLIEGNPADASDLPPFIAARYAKSATHPQANSTLSIQVIIYHHSLSHPTWLAWNLQTTMLLRYITLVLLAAAAASTWVILPVISLLLLLGVLRTFSHHHHHHHPRRDRHSSSINWTIAMLLCSPVAEFRGQMVRYLAGCSRTFPLYLSPSWTSSHLIVNSTCPRGTRRKQFKGKNTAGNHRESMEAARAQISKQVNKIREFNSGGGGGQTGATCWGSDAHKSWLVSFRSRLFKLKATLLLMLLLLRFTELFLVYLTEDKSHLLAKPGSRLQQRRVVILLMLMIRSIRRAANEKLIWKESLTSRIDWMRQSCKQETYASIQVRAK